MIANYNIDITEFIRITNAGVFAADYSQIRAALIQRYKDIYGADLDLSTGSADGTWIADVALIINNMCQTIKNLYSNLNVNTASGVYLDALCALSNVKRKSSTKSTANLLVTNELSTLQSFDNLTFIDKSGLEWNYDSSISFLANETKAITVKCSEAGEIEAPAGWIYQTLELTNLTVVQENAASVGLNDESDEELRARRNLSNGENGITVLESLMASILKIAGIIDCKIYNNNTFNSQTALDGTTINPSAVYIIIRAKENTTIDDNVLGNTIYLKLTPGIVTTESAVNKKKSYTYIPYINDTAISQFNQIVYWKQAEKLTPSISIVVTPLSYFAIDEFDDIVAGPIEYLNNLKIGQDIDLDQLRVETIYSDPMFKGNSTFTLSNITVSNSSNPDAYFYYSKFFVKANGSVTDGTNTIAIADGEFTLDGGTTIYKLYNNCIENLSDNSFTEVVNNQFELSGVTYRITITSVSKDTNNYTIQLS